jgi:pyrimidine operon attenuation protein/uracil phosphoribosyltransferase
MDMSTDLILNHRQITSKITRLAWQIYENNMDETVLWIAGIDKRGMDIADLIIAELSKISHQELRIMNIVIDRKNFEPNFFSDHSLSDLKDAVVIVVDDVLNSGKTIFSAMLPMLQHQVAKIQVAVLASRSHRLFPVRADFVGISMATTLQEHLNFDNINPQDLKLTLS